MNPVVYLKYLKSKNWVPSRTLGQKLILSFMPTGLDPKVWDSSQAEKFFLGRLRKLPGDIEFLSSFGIGGPAARMHLALAIESGVKEVVIVGTAGAIAEDLKIGDLVQLQGGSRSFSDAREVSFSTVFDMWDKPSEGADVVEMEASYLFAWCQERSVKCTELAVVSDLLAKNGWEPGFDQISDSLGRAHRLAYGALREV